MDMMDSKKEILRNVRGVLGCNGVRCLEDLAPMRQETLERRLTAANAKLQPTGKASIYATWLQQQAFRAKAAPPVTVIERWCHYLARRGCGKAMLQVVWMQAALTELDKWCGAMNSELVRDVRKHVFDTISATYPVEFDNSVSQGTAMDVDTTGPSVSGCSGATASDDAMEIETHASFAARGAGASSAMVRATQDEPSDSDSELTMEEHESPFGGAAAAKTRFRGDRYKVGGMYRSPVLVVSTAKGITDI